MPSPLSKRIAGRVTGACSHTVPVLVPCVECVEKQLDGWEQRIRDECIKSLTDDMKNAKADVVRWKAEVDRVNASNNVLREKVEDMKKWNERLVGQLAESKRDADDLRTRLHADQAVVTGSIAKMVNEL